MENFTFDTIIKAKLEAWQEPLDAADTSAMMDLLAEGAFDSLIHQKLADFEADFQPHHWAVLSQTLDQQTFDKHIQERFEELGSQIPESDWETFEPAMADLSFVAALREKLETPVPELVPDWEDFQQSWEQHSFDAQLQSELEGLETPYLAADWALMQQQMDNHAFDQGVKRKLDGLRSPYQFVDWLRLKNHLDRTRAKRPFWWLTLLLLALLGGLTYLYLTPQTKLKQQKPEWVVNPPAQNQQSDASIQQTTPNPLTEIQASEPAQKPQNQTQNVARPISTPAQKPIINQADIPVPPTNIAVQSIQQPPTPNQQAVVQNVQPVQPEQPEQPNQPLEPAAHFIEQEKKLQQSYPDKPVQMLGMQLPELESQAQFGGVVVKNHKAFKPSVTVAVLANMNGSTLELSQAVSQGYAYGLRTQFRFARQWSLVVDGMKGQNAYLFVKRRRVDSKTFEKMLYAGSFDYIALPVSLRRDWETGRNSRFYVQAGIIPMKSVENYEEYTSPVKEEDLPNKTILAGTPTATLARQMTSWKNAQLAMGISKQLGHWSWGVEPHFQYWGTKTGMLNSKVYVFGVNGSLGYTF